MLVAVLGMGMSQPARSSALMVLAFQQGRQYENGMETGTYGNKTISRCDKLCEGVKRGGCGSEQVVRIC